MPERLSIINTTTEISQSGAVSLLFFVFRKTRDSRVVEKRLTDEEKILRLRQNRNDLPVKEKTANGGFIYEKGNQRRKQFSTYKMELQVPYSVDNRILDDDTCPVIYRKGKIMYHLDFLYQEMCDSDHYSIDNRILEDTCPVIY